MLPYGGRDLARAHRTVRANTIQIAEEIPESHYDFVAAPHARTVGQIFTHIALLDSFAAVHREGRTSFDGVDFPKAVAALTAEEQRPRSKTEILALLRERGEAFASWLETLSDEFLAEPFRQPPGLPPETKSRLEMLLSVKEHEMHHRGQLMLIERMLGLVPHLTRRRQERFAAALAATPPA